MKHDSLQDVHIGCMVEVTGICMLETENWRPSVKMHSSILFSKLGASNLTEAVAIALRKHLLKI